MSELAAITAAESKRLVELEEIIEKGVGTFLRVGEALAEIRDSRLYRIEHATFEDYCREEWQMARRTAYQFIDGAVAAENVRHGAHVEPTNERQVRPLTKLETPEQQREAWTVATETAAAEGKPVTAKHVETAVEKVQEQSAPKAERINFKPSNGMQYATMAIANLEKIQPNDTELTDALEKVQRYISKRLKK